MANKFQNILFTTSVKEAQEHYGSRKHFEKFESGPDHNLILTDIEQDFIQTERYILYGDCDEASPIFSIAVGQWDF